MIERFNFYDIYGYLLPGTLLFALLWLPFGLTSGLPSKEISTTLLLLALAYVAGHVLQTVALVVVPSNIPDLKGELRAPSSILLDADNKEFNQQFKEDLARKVKRAFGAELPGDDTSRKAAFFQARAYLIRNKAASYAEQFEGLYAMMRGLACTFYVGFAYLAGWALSFHWKLAGVSLGAWWVLVASIGGVLLASEIVQYIGVHPAIKKEGQRLQQERASEANSFLAVCGLLYAAGMGYFLGTWKPAPERMEFFLWAALPVMLVAGRRCLLAYRNYAQDFAETVWRDFSCIYSDDPCQDICDDNSV
jgi:hypothetical protein